jgi:signal transduction histidine kinase
MKARFSPRYFLASVLLLSALTALFTILIARRTQHELSRQLEESGLILADAIETSSRAAILGNALMEEMIAQRLLDNARLVDQLLLTHPPDAKWLAALATMNHLSRVELLDRDGRPYTPPPPAGMAPMGGMMGPPLKGPRVPDEALESHRAMMMYMWGRRWAPPPAGETAPPAIQDRRFWEGSVFGVAMGARSFPGIITVHADADYVLNFSKEIGVQRQVEELGRQGGIRYIALLDHGLTVVASSDPARLGHSDGDAALRSALESGRPLTRVIDAADTDRVYEILRPFVLGGSETGLLRIGLSTASMDMVWRRDRWMAIGLAAGVLGLGALGLGVIFYAQHRHLAEVKALEAEVERTERLSTLGNMAAAVAHEIRNPLNAVSMGLQRLHGEFEPPEALEYRRLVELMQTEVRRLDRIVEEFLGLARPLTLKQEPIRVADLLDEVELLVEAQARGAGVRIERGLAADVSSFRGDHDRLKQVLLNLALNALQAMPRGGRLELGAAVSGSALTLSVSDTGEGIRPEVLPRVFDPYVTTKAQGLGLGLAIARRIVEAHGGRIEAESRPGLGSTFRVTLPVAGADDG